MAEQLTEPTLPTSFAVEASEDGILRPPVSTSRVPARWIYEGERRLDAGFYGGAVTAALDRVASAGLPVDRLGDHVERVFYPGRFKRVWAQASRGVPFYGGTEILHLRPETEKFLSRTQTENLEELIVDERWLLITRSGSVGRVAFASRRLHGAAVSEHLIRVIVASDALRDGYVAAYLLSPTGQALLTRGTFGAAVPEVEPHHVEAVPVPIADENDQEAIDALVTRARGLRDEAADGISESVRAIHDELRLPEFDDSVVPYLEAPEVEDAVRPRPPHPRPFALLASELQSRFDASFHVPVARAAIAQLQLGQYPPVRLAGLVERVYVAPRFARNYVAAGHGVPFLQGRQLPQMTPTDQQFLSVKHTPGLERWIIESGWVLVTCSGTIGRVVVASKGQDRWAASQHILRIIGRADGAHPGYLAAFLMTPYGQHQLTAKVYGGVVDEITESDTEAVWVPNAPEEVQRRIGEPLLAAYRMRDEANAIEQEAIGLVETLLQPEV
jgi:type I restriction enzyme, S subunit